MISILPEIRLFIASMREKDGIEPVRSNSNSNIFTETPNRFFNKGD